MNSRAIESLIKCGALDGLGANRRQLLAISKTVLDDVEYEAKKNQGGQLSFLIWVTTVQRLHQNPNCLI